MFGYRICLIILTFFSLLQPVFASGPAGVGLASDPADALANALPEVVRFFCEKEGVSYHDANKIFLQERRKYPKDVLLTLHFRINRAPLSLEDKRAGCIMGFEPWGSGNVGSFEGNVLSTHRIQISAVEATGLGPPITHFPGVDLRIEPTEKKVSVGEDVYFSKLIAKFSVNGTIYEVEVRPNDAIWESSDRDAVSPIPATVPGKGLIMTPSGGAQAQGFSTHRAGTYSVIASLPSGSSTYATLEVMPKDEMLAYWIVRHHDQQANCSICLSGNFQIAFDENGIATSGKFTTECSQMICGGQQLYSLCPMPPERMAQMSGQLKNIHNDRDARILKADIKAKAAGPNEKGSLNGDYQRVGDASPYQYLGSGRMQIPFMQGDAVVGWAQGTWQTDTHLQCSK